MTKRGEARVAVDLVVFGLVEGELSVLMGRRPNAPYEGFWALPGEFRHSGQPVDELAREVLERTTGVERAWVEQLATFDRPPVVDEGGEISTPEWLRTRARRGRLAASRRIFTGSGGGPSGSSRRRTGLSKDRGEDMFGIGYFKAQPTEFVRKVAGGRVNREGQALSFYYLKCRTSIVVVPVSSADAAFVFNEQTGNYQAVTIQGQLTYRIVEPRRTIEMLNYVIDPKRRAHVSQDPERLEQRIVVAVQMETRRQVEGKSLEEVLGNAASISAEVQEEVRSRALRIS